MSNTSDTDSTSPSANPTTPSPAAEPWANTDSWLRVLMTVVFGVIFWLSLWLLGLAVVINLVLLVATGKANASVSRFAHQLAQYQRQIIAFATLSSDDQPFPFGLSLPSASNAPDEPDNKIDPSATATDPTPAAAPTDGDTPVRKTTSVKKKPATRKKRKKKTETQAKPSEAGDNPSPDIETD